jgi:hypothetical protein
MKAEELRARLLELGADIPLPTLRRWASDNEGLIPKPLQYYKPLERGVGRPKKDKGKESEAHPGRFSYWTQESLEAAAAVWSIRYLSRSFDSSEEDGMILVRETSQKDVTKNAIIRAQQMASSLHTLLYTDCKQAANRFRAYLWPTGFVPDEDEQPRIATFGEDRLYALILLCIQACEKVRHHLELNTPINIIYDWVIREDGSSAWNGMRIQRTYGYSNKISLSITHLTPCENGYSKDYGFPLLKEYMRDGFVDNFWLSGAQLCEEFSQFPYYRVRKEVYEDQKFIDYWDDDPYGWADLAAELPDEYF